MAFDAGEIRAYLKLDKTQFVIDLDKAKAEADAAFKDGIEVQVTPKLDEADVEKVLAEEEPLRKDIEVKVKPELGDTSAIATETEALGKALPGELLKGMKSGEGSGSDGGISGLIKDMLGQGFNKSEMATTLEKLGYDGASISSALEEALGSGGGSKPDGKIKSTMLRDLVSEMLGQGLSAKDIDKIVQRDTGASATRIENALAANLLKDLQSGKVDGQSLKDSLGKALVKDMTGGGGGGIASDIAGALLPTESEMTTAFDDTLSKRMPGGNGHKLLDLSLQTFMEGFTPGKGKGQWGTGGAVIEESIIKGMLANGMSESEIQSELQKSGVAKNLVDGLIRDITTEMNKTGGGSGASWNADLPNLIKGMIGKGLTPAAVEKDLKEQGFGASTISDAMMNVLGEGDKGGGGFGSIIGKWLTGGGGKKGGFGKTFMSGPGGPFDAFTFGAGGMRAIFNPVGAGAATAFLGAFGAAVSAGLAGTLIGIGGTAVALLPGFMDLQKGLAAYQAQHTPGASTKGFTGAQLNLGTQLGGLFGAGSKGLGAAETQIMPQITKFINAITKAMPLMNEFAKPAIKAMTGFFNAIDHGLGSGGFKSFVGTMSKDVGPIMKQFGQVLLNLGGAFGGFLKLFGGVAATKIGPWFVTITGNLDKFMNHIKLGPGFVQGMVTVFSNIGKVIGAAWTILKIFGTALAPVGLQFFRIIGWMAKWIERIVKIIPAPVLASLITLAITAFSIGKGINLAAKAIKGVMGIMENWQLISETAGKAVGLIFSPTGLIIIGVIALGIIIYELYKHWHTVWKDIKRVTLDAWHFIDNDIFHPIAHFFDVILKSSLNNIKGTWDTVWNGIKDTVQTVWSVIKPIFDGIITAVSKVMGAISSIGSIAGKIGGGITGGIGKALSFVGLASGGPVNAGQPYMVGEQGPELFMPSTSGSIIPHGAMSNYGRGGGQQIVFNIDARGHSNPTDINTAVRNGIGATLPNLQAALARGAA